MVFESTAIKISYWWQSPNQWHHNTAVINLLGGRDPTTGINQAHSPIEFLLLLADPEAFLVSHLKTIYSGMP